MACLNTVGQIPQGRPSPVSGSMENLSAQLSSQTSVVLGAILLASLFALVLMAIIFLVFLIVLRKRVGILMVAVFLINFTAFFRANANVSAENVCLKVPEQFLTASSSASPRRRQTTFLPLSDIDLNCFSLKSRDRRSLLQGWSSILGVCRVGCGWGLRTFWEGIASVVGVDVVTGTDLVFGFGAGNMKSEPANSHMYRNTIVTMYCLRPCGDKNVPTQNKY